MLQIRKQQMEAFEADAARWFETQMVADLKRRWPEQCAALGEEGVRASVQSGIERAEGYGIVMRDDVAGFIRLMYELSPEFDTDQRYPWIAEVLNDPDLDPLGKVDVLYSLLRQQPAGSASEGGCR